MSFNEFLQYQLLGNTILNYLLCVGILLLGYMFKTLVSRVLSKIVFRFLRPRTEGVSEAQFQELLIQPIAIIVFLITLYFALNVLDYPVRSSEIGRHEPKFQVLMFRLYQLAIIMSTSWIVLRLIDFAGLVFRRRAEQKPSRLSDQLIPFAKDLFKVFVMCVAFLVILGKVFSVDVTALIGGLGIGGLAVAFAAKESLENLIASFTIFFDRPFAVGDIVEVGNVSGTIEKVGFRSTRLRTAERTYVTVPNKSMIDKPLDNLSLRTARRVSFTLALSHLTTSDQLRTIIRDAHRTIQGHPLVQDGSQVQFAALTPAAKEITVHYYVETTDFNEYLAVKQELNYRLVEVVEHNGGSFASANTTFFRMAEGGGGGAMPALQSPEKPLV